MDCIVHGIAKSGTRLSDFPFHLFFMPKSGRRETGNKAAVLVRRGSPLDLSVSAIWGWVILSQGPALRIAGYLATSLASSQFPGVAVVKSPPANEEMQEMGFTPGLGRSLE